MRGEMATRSGFAAAAREVRHEPWAGEPTRVRGQAARLSGQEVSVLRELARGLSTEEVAERLVVSPHTVRTHVKNGMRKLGARTRAHAVAVALSEGAIEPLEPGE
jgi:DNA-binding CsgD family transcriptional regulator